MSIVRYLLSVMMACILCSDTIAAEIRNVTAKQRFPWNGKVDISYEIVGDVAEGLPTWDVPILLVVATNRATRISYIADVDVLYGDTGTEEGMHHVVWDLNAQRIKFRSDDVVFTVSYTTAQYCVIDLSAGARASSYYPITYMFAPPSGGFTANEYKTTKLVLRLIEPGSFKMGDAYDVTLTKPFYCGIFEVTQKQYSLVMGSNPSRFSGDNRPVEKVSYDMIRGSADGANWPSSSAVDAPSFIGKLRAQTGLDFDLPTEAQWEYACRAGTKTAYSYGRSANGNYMWYSSNTPSTYTHEVGTKVPNPWGLYDMHGNVSEYCLDWYSSDLVGGTDPKGPSSGWGRVVRGGSWNGLASACTSSSRGYEPLSSESSDRIGFRLVRTLLE